MRLRVRPRAREGLAQNDAVADLLRIIGRTELAPEMIAPLTDELAALHSKLPRELMEEVDALNLNTPEAAARVLEADSIAVSRRIRRCGSQKLCRCDRRF